MGAHLAKTTCCPLRSWRSSRLVDRHQTVPICVYILQCSDGTLYTGWTSDLPARLAAHQGGRASRYTRSRRPLRLVYCEELPSESLARRREAAIKGMSRRAKLALVEAARSKQ